MPALSLYSYQRRWLADKSRFKVGMFARQTGKTFTTTLDIVDSCMAAEAAGRRERWVILSRGERQAKEAMEEGVKRHAAAYQVALDVFRDQFRTADKITYTQFDTILPGGSKITALPANPDTARGFSANVFLDEFAFHADSRKIWRSLFPVISGGYRLVVTSTPNGKRNKFYELMTSADTGQVWSRHVCDIYQAVRDGLPRDIEQLRRGLSDADAWSQEYELQWLDEASAWLPFDLINACEHDHAGRADRYQGGACYAGVDIGRRNDLYVIWVIERIGDVLWTREVITARRASFREQAALLDEVMRRYHPLRVCIDQTGMGEKPVEDAQYLYGATRVEGVVFTAHTKLRLATIAKQVFEDRRIRVPMGDDAIRSDLHKIKKEVGPTGTPRFIAERDADGHADRAWACFLAIAAADNPAGEITYLAGHAPGTTPHDDLLHFMEG